MPRAKNPSVTPERRRDWLRRYEVDEESPPKIAKKDIYDVRTVRKQLKIARHERDVREAKLMVLRDAMENHYRDLCKFADQLYSGIEMGKPVSQTLKDNLLWSALQQHLPQSPIWKNIERWDSDTQEIRKHNSAIRETIKQKLKETRLIDIVPDQSEEIMSGAIDYVSSQVDDWARGNTGLDIDAIFKIKPLEQGICEAELGAFFNVKIPSGAAQKIKKLLTNFESRIQKSLDSWEEYNQLNNLYSELKKLRRDTQEELETISLRRVVLGQCKYCPL